MILDQIISECLEVRAEINKNIDQAKLQEEIGDLLHSVISLCIFSKFNVEETIQKTNAKFFKRIQLLKSLALLQGIDNLNGQSVDFILSLWKKMKSIEKSQQSPL